MDIVLTFLVAFPRHENEIAKPPLHCEWPEQSYR
jgi:hypothetical protein